MHTWLYSLRLSRLRYRRLNMGSFSGHFMTYNFLLKKSIAGALLNSVSVGLGHPIAVFAKTSSCSVRRKSKNSIFGTLRRTEKMFKKVRNYKFQFFSFSQTFLPEFLLLCFVLLACAYKMLLTIHTNKLWRKIWIVKNKVLAEEPFLFFNPYFSAGSWNEYK